MQKKGGKALPKCLHIQDIVQKKYTVYSKYVGIIFEIISIQHTVNQTVPAGQ